MHVQNRSFDPISLITTQIETIAIQSESAEQQSCKKISDIVDESGIVKHEYAGKVRIALRPESEQKIRIFLNEPALYNQTSLWQLLMEVFQYVQEVSLLSDELVVFLDATIHEGLQQLGVQANFIAHHTVCHAFTFRFLTNYHAELAHTVKAAFQTKFGIFCSRVFSNHENTLSGITHVASGEKKFHFVFAAPTLQTPCFATYDAVQVVISPQKTTLKHFYCLEQWLVDTAHKMLRPITVNAGSLKLCIRAMRKGMCPTPAVYEMFSQCVTKDTLISLWLEANNDGQGMADAELIHACIIMHITQRIKIDSSEFLSSIQKNLQNSASFFACALQLVANNVLSYSMLEAILVIASLFQDTSDMCLDSTVRVITIPNIPVRIPLNVVQAIEVFTDFPLHNEQVAYLFESLFLKKFPTNVLQPIIVHADVEKFLQQALTSDRCIQAFICYSGLVHCQSFSPEPLFDHFLDVYNTCPGALKKYVLAAMGYACPGFTFQESEHISYDFVRALMQQIPLNIVRIYNSAKKSVNTHIKRDVALYLTTRDPGKALVLLKEVLENLSDVDIQDLHKTFPLKKDFIALLLSYPAFAKKYIFQLVAEDAAACLGAYRQLGDASQKLHMLKEITKCWNLVHHPLQLVTEWAQVLSQAPSTDIIDILQPLLHMCCACTVYSEPVGICLQACAQQDQVTHDVDFRGFLSIAFCASAVRHCPRFFEAMIQNLLLTQCSLHADQKKHIRIELQHVIDEAQKRHCHHFVLKVLYVYQALCNNESVLGENYKRALVMALEADMLNEAKSTQDDCAWYFSQMLVGKRSTAIEPYRQAVILIRTAVLFRRLVIAQESDAIRYVHMLSTQLDDAERQALEPELERLQRVAFHSELFASFRAVCSLSSRVPAPVQKSELAQLFEKKQWLVLGKKLMSSNASDGEAIRLAPHVLVNLLKIAPKPFGIVFQLIQKFHLTNFWMKMFEQCVKEQNSEEFSVLIEQLMQSKNNIPVEQQKTIWIFVFTKGRVLFTVRALCCLQKIAYFEGLFKDEFVTEPIQTSLTQTLDVCLDILTKHVDRVKTYFTCMCSLFNKISQKYSDCKPLLGWKLFCLFRYDPSVQNFAQLTKVSPFVSMYLLKIFEEIKLHEVAHATQNEIRKNSTTHIQHTHVKLIHDVFKPYFGVCCTQKLSNECFSLLESIAKKCQIAEVHLFLLDRLQGHVDINVINLLFHSIEYIKKCNAEFPREYFAVFNTVVTRVINEGDEFLLARVYDLFFVDPEAPPSACMNPSHYIKEMESKPPFSIAPTNPLKDMLIAKYPILLQKALRNDALAHTVLNVALSVIVCHKDFAKIIYHDGLIDVLMKLLLETVKKHGWTEENCNFYHFLFYLEINLYIVKNQKANRLQTEYYECCKKVIMNECCYKDSCVAVSLSYINAARETFLESENAYCVFTNSFIQHALIKRYENKSSATSGLLDFVVQNLKILVACYPQKVVKKHIEMLIGAVTRDDPLFLKHTQIVLPLLRLAGYKAVLTSEDIRRYLAMLQLADYVIADENIAQITAITSEIQMLIGSISSNEVNKILGIIKKLNFWRECYCVQSFSEFSNAVSLLCVLLGQQVEGNVTNEVAQALNNLFFSNGLMFGYDRAVTDRPLLLKSTEGILEAFFRVYRYHIQNHPDLLPLQFEKINNSTHRLKIPDSRRQAFFYLEFICIFLEKSYESNVFIGNEALFLRYCEMILECFECDHKNRAAYATNFINLPVRIFAKLATHPQYVSQSFVLLNRFWSFLKTDTTLCGPDNVYKFFIELLNRRCIEAVHTQNDANIVLRWLISFVNCSNAEVICTLVRQLNNILLFKPQQEGALYNKLPVHIRSLIV